VWFYQRHGVLAVLVAATTFLAPAGPLTVSAEELCPIGFVAHQDFATGSGPFGVATADFNADGATDVVTANFANNVSVLLNACTTTTTLAPLTPSTFGQTVTFSASVSPSTASGTVTFFDGSTPLGTGTLTGGTATYSTSTLAVGSHTITARYDGDANDLPSTSAPQSQLVNPAIATATATATATGMAAPTQTVTPLPGTATATPPAPPVPPVPPTATVTGTAGSGGGGSGDEPQDVLICESQPGGPRELRIKGSEWPIYQSRAARGPCPTSGAPAVVQALPPMVVSGTAGTIPEPGPPGPLTEGAVATPLRLERAGRVRLTVLGARTNFCDGDILLLAPALSPTPAPGTADGTLPPGARRLWSSYLRHVGESVELGPYPAGTTLVLGAVPRGICAGGGSAPRPSDGAFARVASETARSTWNVWFEDFLPAGADYDDVLVRVEVLPDLNR
jgi:hypothetical protein